MVVKKELRMSKEYLFKRMNGFGVISRMYYYQVKKVEFKRVSITRHSSYKRK